MGSSKSKIYYSALQVTLDRLTGVDVFGNNYRSKDLAHKAYLDLQSPGRATMLVKYDVSGILTHDIIERNFSLSENEEDLLSFELIQYGMFHFPIRVD